MQQPPPPDNQRIEFSQMFEQLHKTVTDMITPNKLIAIAHYLHPDLLKQFMTIVGPSYQFYFTTHLPWF